MLSDRELRELGAIEQGLREDSRLAAAFPGGRTPLHRRLWVLRSTIALGLLMFMSGLVLDDSGLALRGALIAGLTYGWLRWRVRPARTKAAGCEPGADHPWRIPPSVP